MHSPTLTGWTDPFGDVYHLRIGEADTGTQDSDVKVAYLVNRYPAPSHSFIRREICELEKQGVEVLRISLRDTSADFLDEPNRAESALTRVVLIRPLDWLAKLPAYPLGRLLRNWTTAFKLGLKSDRGPLIHLGYLLEAARVATWCREHGVGHLHAHFATNPAAVAHYAHLLTGLPYSFTVHGPEVFDRPMQLSLEEKVSSARFVACISEFTRAQLCRWCSAEDWDKLKVVRCGLDFETEREAVTEPSTRFVCVGRLCEQKGYLHLLEALKLLADEGKRPEVVILGDGPLRSVLETRLGKLMLQDSVRLRGWASQEEVFQEIADCRALLCPSLAEGLPVVLMEAFRLKRPVVASCLSGIPELVRPDLNGWLVPAGDTQALARAIDEVLEAPDLRLREMGEHGCQQVKRLHDIGREVEKLAALFAR